MTTPKELEAMDMFVAPNQRDTVKECVIGSAETKGTVRIHSSAIPLFRAIKSALTRTAEEAKKEERERIREMLKGSWTDFDEKCDCNMCFVWKKLLSRLEEGENNKGE